MRLPEAASRYCHSYPATLVDEVLELEPGRRIVAVKNVTVIEDYFQGHFPGSPLMPGVLMIESLAQAASVLIGESGDHFAERRNFLWGVDGAKFRRQVVPGDVVRLEVTLTRIRPQLVRARGVASVGAHVVAEAGLLLAVAAEPPRVHPTAIVETGACIGAGTVIGPHAVIGRHVVIGHHCTIGASAVIDGWTEIGDRTEIFPFASIGLIPQDLKFRGEQSRLVIGRSNVFREFVTVHRGTQGGGGVTRIGDHNLFMAYAHVAHDCTVGHHTIFGNGATLGGHVTVEDYATVSALSGVHQFCRVGQHAFIGGSSVVTKDALPFGKTVGNRARIYGLNTVGLMRRGFSPDTIRRLKRAYRYLLQSKLNTSRALGEIEQDAEVSCPEVLYLTHFIRSSARGVTLRRAGRRAEEAVVDD